MRKLKAHLFCICTISPCLAVPGSQKKLDTPILESVAETFLAINPDLPTPAQIILPLQFASTSTAFTKFVKNFI